MMFIEIMLLLLPLTAKCDVGPKECVGFSVGTAEILSISKSCLHIQSFKSLTVLGITSMTWVVIRSEYCWLPSLCVVLKMRSRPRCEICSPIGQTSFRDGPLAIFGGYRLLIGLTNDGRPLLSVSPFHFPQSQNY
eukprot:scaffold1183_cov114-Cylindrotheca_fusiformis.AAC.10